MASRAIAAIGSPKAGRGGWQYPRTEKPAAPRAIESARHGFGYGAPRPRPLALLLVVALHAFALALLLTQKMLMPATIPPAPMLVVHVPLPVPPPAPLLSAPDVRMETPEILVPLPVIEIAREAPPVMVARPAAEQPAPPAPAPGITDVDAVVPVAASLPALSATMLEAPPPRYPLEARQRKEQGIVVLEVQLSSAGRVEHVAVYCSSGSPRLDKAALDAVRRWRWSPMLRDGVAVAVRGLVEIPFVLTKR